MYTPVAMTETIVTILLISLLILICQCRPASASAPNFTHVKASILLPIEV